VIPDDTIADIRAQVARLPSSGGCVRFYSWDRAEHDEHMAVLRSAAFRRRLLVIEGDGGHGRYQMRLVPQSEAPIRCCSGTRGAGRRRARRRRRSVERTLEALRFRDRLAKTIGWDAAVRDPRFQDLMSAAMPQRRGTPRLSRILRGGQ
jgi:hypothetical protein